jgi:uncharacterized membrane protein (Fun14 family)
VSCVMGFSLKHIVGLSLSRMGVLVFVLYGLALKGPIELKRVILKCSNP